MKKTILIFGATALLLVTARATSIVFDTFGAGNTYNDSLGFDVGSAVFFPDNYSDIEEAAQFTAGASGDLASVDLGLTYFTGFTATPVNVYLAGNGSSPFDPSNEIFLGSGTPTAAYQSTNNSVVGFSVSGTVPVTIGTTYWLVLKPASATGLDVWNAAADPGPVLGVEDVQGHVNGPLFTASYPFLPAFRLTASGVSSVPDSGNTLLLFCGAVATLLVLRPKLRPSVG